MKRKYSYLLFVYRVVRLIMLLPALVLSQEDLPEFSLEDSVTVTAEKGGKVATYNTIGTKLPVAIRYTPASVGVVTDALSKIQDNTVLGDALKNISGINTQTNFGVHDYFIIRGFNSLDNGLILTDGTPEPEATFYHLYNTERVEALKGPGAFLYGGNPLSGTINVVRKKPLFENFAGAGISYGSYQSYRATLDMGIANAGKTLAFRGNGLWQKSDQYRDDKDDEVFAVNPSVSWRTGQSGALNLDVEYVDSRYSPDSGLPLLFELTVENGPVNPVIPGVPRTNSYQPETDVSNQKVLRAKLAYRLQINRTVSLNNKFYYTDLDWDSRSMLLNGAFPSRAGEVVSRSASSLDDRQQLIGNQLELVFSFHTGLPGHHLLTGFEVSRLGDEFLLEFKGAPPVLLLDPQTELPLQPGGDARQFYSRVDGRNRVLAPYLIDRISFSEQFQLFLGGRYDALNYRDERSDLNPFTGVVEKSQTDRSYHQFSPMAGIMFSPVPTTSLYANAGRAFAPPSTQVPGNPEPEESRQFEAGLRQQLWKGKLSTAVAYFDLKKDHIEIFDRSGIGKQTGTQRSRGIELELLAEPWNDLLMFLSYAYTEAELTEFSEINPFASGLEDLVNDFSGNTPSFAPRHILNIWINKDLAGGIGMGGGARYLSSQFIAPDNAFRINEALTFDAAVYYRSGMLRWSLNFKNITDNEYEVRGFGASSVIPAHPFTVYGGLEFDL